MIRSRLFWQLSWPYLAILTVLLLGFFLPYQSSPQLLSLFAVVTCILLFFHIRSVTQAIKEIQRGAVSLAAGDFTIRVPQSGIPDIDVVVGSLNTMAQKLSDKLSAIEKHEQEREAILAGMGEGLIALDDSKRIIEINEAAGKLLGIDIEKARGQLYSASVRSSAIGKVIDTAISSGQKITKEVEIADSLSQDLRYIRISGNIIKKSGQLGAKAVFVMSDITRLRRLETVRKDFVANVSHELKTPITSIKGFVETLLNSPSANEEERKRFLQIIEKHANRLTSIIDDLLTLARLEEQEGEKTQRPLTRENVDINEIVSSAIEFCGPRAHSKEILVDHSPKRSVTATVNRSLIEQAVINILDNAIKYTEPNTTVSLKAEEKQSSVRIMVSDQGPGISPEHKDRIFERFYRVDKARSRGEGGTGLGLAIVKHIAAVHGGQVGVETTPGSGATFWLEIPKAA